MSFKISAVTATFNRKEYLPRCMESVNGQEYSDKEHVVVDGGSSDGTVELLQEYSERHPHLRFISEKDNGLSDALNKGLALASGDAVGVIGDDDFYEPNAFAIVANAFKENPDAGLVVGGCRFFRNDGTTEKIVPARYTNRNDLIECWRHWGKRVWLPHASAFVRREVLDDIGGFEIQDRYAMDYHHYLKITEKYPIVLVDEILSNFRSDEGTLSFSSYEKSWDETLRISRKYWGAQGSKERQSFERSFLIYSVARGTKRVLKSWLKPLIMLRNRRRSMGR